MKQHSVKKKVNHIKSQKNLQISEVDHSLFKLISIC